MSRDARPIYEKWGDNFGVTVDDDDLESYLGTLVVLASAADPDGEEIEYTSRFDDGTMLIRISSHRRFLSFLAQADPETLPGLVLAEMFGDAIPPELDQERVGDLIGTLIELAPGWQTFMAGSDEDYFELRVD